MKKTLFYLFAVLFVLFASSGVIFGASDQASLNLKGSVNAKVAVTIVGTTAAMSLDLNTVTTRAVKVADVNLKSNKAGFTVTFNGVSNGDFTLIPDPTYTPAFANDPLDYQVIFVDNDVTDLTGASRLDNEGFITVTDKAIGQGLEKDLWIEYEITDDYQLTAGDYVGTVTVIIAVN